MLRLAGLVTVKVVQVSVRSQLSQDDSSVSIGFRYELRHARACWIVTMSDHVAKPLESSALPTASFKIVLSQSSSFHIYG